jgi:hypothetical protein
MLRVNVWEKVLSLWGHKGIAFSGANLGLWAVPKRVIEEDCKVSSLKIISRVFFQQEGC